MTEELDIPTVKSIAVPNKVEVASLTIAEYFTDRLIANKQQSHSAILNIKRKDKAFTATITIDVKKGK